MSLDRRLAIATRGFRGDLGSKHYLNEIIQLDQPTINISTVQEILLNSLEIVSLTTEVEVISVDISTLEIEGAY